MLALTFPQGETLLLPTRVVGSQVADAGCEYRLAFWQLDEIEIGRLADLLRSPPSAPTGAYCSPGGDKDV